MHGFVEHLELEEEIEGPDGGRDKGIPVYVCVCVFVCVCVG